MGCASRPPGLLVLLVGLVRLVRDRCALHVGKRPVAIQVPGQKLAVTLQQADLVQFRHAGPSLPACADAQRKHSGAKQWNRSAAVRAIRGHQG